MLRAAVKSRASSTQPDAISTIPHVDIAAINGACRSMRRARHKQVCVPTVPEYQSRRCFDEYKREELA
jgi:hypothetical protein